MVHFSSRLPWDQTDNRWTDVLVQKKASGVALLDLTQSNPLHVQLSVPTGAGADVFPSVDLYSYRPDPRGLRSARECVAQYYAQKNIQIDPDHLVLCASTSEAYSWLFQLFCDANQEVLFPTPSYPLFEHLAGLALATPRSYSLFYDGMWNVDASFLQEALGPQTRALVAVHPNNPTGSYLKPHEMKWLLQYASHQGVPLIVDEVFLDYPLDAVVVPGSFAGVASVGETLCFVLSGASKVLGMPQIKLSWIYVTGTEPIRSQAQRNLEWIADTFLSVNGPVQQALPRLFLDGQARQQAILQRIQQNKRCLQDALKGTACHMLRIEGGWSAVVRLPSVLSSEEWALDLLMQDDVVVHPGHFFDFQQEAHVVLSLLPPVDVFSQGVQRVVDRVSFHAKDGCFPVENI